jgi:hypothetical protein
MMQEGCCSQTERTLTGGAVIALIIVGLMATGCTYTQLADSPPEYVEYVEPAPYYYNGPFAELSQWGEWIDTGPLGWVWQPYVGPHWQPYYHGNWVWSQWDWTWVSYEPFGWATYHYGFWHYDAIYGWVWLPGEQWFPARVSWMYYEDYIFWAPIPPPGYYIADPWDVHVDFIWMGVRADHFMQSDIGRYRVKNRTAVWERVPKGKVRRESPKTGYIERRTRTKIRPVAITVEKVRKGDREYEKIIMPPAERENVRLYEKRRQESIRQQPQSKSKKSGYTKKGTSKSTRQPESRDTRPSGKKTKTKTKKNEGGKSKEKK